MDHGFTLYNELLHVPLILRLPVRIPGQVIADRVSSIDVMPTLLDLLRVQVSDRVQKQLRGQSLLPAVRGKSPQRNLFAETDYRQYTYKRAIITPEGWKFIRTLENQQRELYHLDSDPGETNNRFKTEPQRATDLEQKLLGHFRSLGHDLEGKRWEVGLNPVYPSQGRESPKE